MGGKLGLCFFWVTFKKLEYFLTDGLCHCVEWQYFLLRLLQHLNMSGNDGKGSEDGHRIFMPGFSVQEVKKGKDTLMKKCIRKSDRNDSDINWTIRSFNERFVLNMTRLWSVTRKRFILKHQVIKEGKSKLPVKTNVVENNRCIAE